MTTLSPDVWGLLQDTVKSRFTKVIAAADSAVYKREFWNLPTVDHDFTDPARLAFRLCSWRLNDAKGDQTIDELLALADLIRAHRNPYTEPIPATPCRHRPCAA